MNSHNTPLENSTSSHKDIMESSDIVILTLFSIISVLGCIGNLSILASIFNNCSLRRVTHILIMNQALSDFLLSALSIPLRMLRISVKKSMFESSVLLSDMYCRSISGLNAAVLGTSSYGLVLLTIDKFLAVKWPLAYRTRMRMTHMSTPIIVSWLVPLTFALCGVFITSLKADLHDHGHDVACIISSTFGKTFALCAYVVMQIIPLIVMCPLYIYIITKVKKSWRFQLHTSTVKSTPATTRRIVHAEAQRKKEIRLTKGILLILGVHIVCLTPIIVLDIMHIIGNYVIPYNLDEIFLLLLHLNAVLDPLIYTRHCEDIKRTMFRMLRRIFPCRCDMLTTQSERNWRRRARRTTLKKPHQMATINNTNHTLRPERVQSLTNVQNSESNDAYVMSTTISSMQ